MKLYGHPFSSYCQKVFVALYEKELAFEGLRHPGPVRLIPEDLEAALAVRMLDRFFDQYVSSPMQRIVADGFSHDRPAHARSTMRGPIVATFPSVRRIGTDTQQGIPDSNPARRRKLDDEVLSPLAANSRSR